MTAPKTFAELLNQKYGRIGTEKRDLFEKKASLYYKRLCPPKIKKSAAMPPRYKRKIDL
jgi:hypothetical protein